MHDVHKLSLDGVVLKWANLICGNVPWCLLPSKLAVHVDLFPLGWLDQGYSNMVHSGINWMHGILCPTEWHIWIPLEADGPGQAGHKKSSMAWSPEIANRSAKRDGNQMGCGREVFAWASYMSPWRWKQWPGGLKLWLILVIGCKPLKTAGAWQAKCCLHRQGRRPDGLSVWLRHSFSQWAMCNLWLVSL